jgi:hypothetical protein
MKYAVDAGSGVMIYMPSFIEICSDIKKLIGGIYKHTGRQTQRHTDSMVIA